MVLGEENKVHLFHRVHASVQEAWQKVIDEYPVGRTVDVFYDSKNPGLPSLKPLCTVRWRCFMKWRFCSSLDQGWRF
jgi:hypothetical protein